MLRDHQLNCLLRRGVSEIIIESEFMELLDSGRPLRLKMGFDPSSPDIHLGHAVGLRKLRQLQEMGHRVVLIVGDWTAQIGDPTGRSRTRPMLTAGQVYENAETYMIQFFRIVDRERTDGRWQTEWFGRFGLADLISLASRFTVAQLLAREDFSRRFHSSQPIAVTELLYPLLQAYDSVGVSADRETPEDIETHRMPPAPELAGKRLSHVVAGAGLAGSVGEARRAQSRWTDARCSTTWKPPRCGQETY